MKLLLDAVKELFVAVFAPLGNLFKGMFGGVFSVITSTFQIQPGEGKKILLVFASFAVIGVSIISLFFTMRDPRPQINMSPFEGLGASLAQETIKAIGSDGDVVVVTLDTNDVASPVYDGQQNSFKETLKKNSSVRISAVEKVIPAFEDSPELFSKEQFLEILAKHPHANAVVSLIGLPMLTEEDLSSIPDRRPKLIISGFDFLGSSLQTLINSDLVQAAIIPRYEPPPATEDEPQTPQEWFDRYYTIITRDNVDSLPEFM